MTKEEVLKKLTGTKVYVGNRSEEVQRKLLEFGFKWIYSGQQVMEDSYLIFIREDGFLTRGTDINDFVEHRYREISINDIISLEVTPEMKPLEVVLVKDTDSSTWELSVFAYKREKELFPFVCFNGCCFKQCIPYEGNEYLLGTKNMPI